jgi:hypothetical protein
MQQRDWFRLVALSGNPGRSWVEEYQTSERQALMMGCQQALDLLRHRKVEEGRELLFRLECCVPSEESPTSFLLVLERHYLPVLAFYHYLVEEFETAEKLLGQAQDAVREAIGQQSFLMPFVDSVLDFAFQRIRIARNRRHWQVMRRRVDHVKAMMEDREALCTLPDGRVISISGLRCFYASLNLGENEFSSLASLLDPALCAETFRRLIGEIYGKTSLIIPYP